MQFKTSKPLGTILKSHGKQGELIISANDDLPENFYQMESIFIEINQDVVPFFLKHVRKKTSSTVVIKLEDVDSLEEANELAGLTWYLPAGEPDVQLAEAKDPGALTGFTLIDQNDKEIGVVEGFIDIPSNALLQVRYHTELVDIPVNEETIHDIDPEKRVIKIEIPDGLLEL